LPIHFYQLVQQMTDALPVDRRYPASRFPLPAPRFPLPRPKGDHLAEFEVYIMLAVAQIGEGEAYGVSIRQEIETRTARPVSIGAVYATLGRLNDKGYVSFSISDSDPVRGGRARKLVALTKLGQRALTHSVTSFTRMAEGLPLVPAPGGRR
jgi:DNA-binding MarR family transcriptional regulator